MAKVATGSGKFGPSAAIVYCSHGSPTRACSYLDLPVRICATGAPQPQLPVPVAGADRERDRRLVLHVGDLQSVAAIDRAGEFGCSGTGGAGASADSHRS